MWCCALLLYLLHEVWSQESVSLTINNYHVYNGEEIMLNCSFGNKMSLRIFTLEAFDGTRRAGFVRCTYGGNVQKEGVFTELTVHGCPNMIPAYVGISMRASTALELDYYCSVRVHDHNNFYNLTSNRLRLTVYVLPEIPRFLPYNLVFNESDLAMLVCESRNGKPAALLKLTVRSRESILTTKFGNCSVSLMFRASLNLQNATVSCSAMNHNFPNMTTKSGVSVNYISTRHNEPIEVYTASENYTIDCSTEVDRFPSVTYKWNFPVSANIEGHLNTSIITIPKGLSGLIYCVAMNDATLKSVMVIYHAVHKNKQKSNSTWKIAVGVGLSVIAIIGCVVIILQYRRSRNLSGGVSTLHNEYIPQGTLGNEETSEQTYVSLSPLNVEDHQYQCLKVLA